MTDHRTWLYANWGIKTSGRRGREFRTSALGYHNRKEKKEGEKEKFHTEYQRDLP